VIVLLVAFGGLFVLLAAVHHGALVWAEHQRLLEAIRRDR
jgi:hypothetical protein